MELERKFRVIADIVQVIGSGTKTIDGVKGVLSRNGMLRATEVESLAMLAMKLGFIGGSDDSLAATKFGLAFEQYMTSLDEQELSPDVQAPNRLPAIDKGNELKLCVTVPPKLVACIEEKFGDSVVDTQTGRKYVVDDCTDQLIVVSPYLDVSVFQLAVSHLYSPATELIVITSEKDFTKYQENFYLKKLKDVINNRFAGGRIFFLQELSSIAHAKVWCCRKSALITSANIVSHSTADNLEIGIYTDDPVFVDTLWSFLNVILSDGGMKCILDTRQ